MGCATGPPAASVGTDLPGARDDEQGSMPQQEQQDQHDAQHLCRLVIRGCNEAAAVRREVDAPHGACVRLEDGGTALAAAVCNVHNRAACAGELHRAACVGEPEHLFKSTGCPLATSGWVPAGRPDSCGAYTVGCQRRTVLSLEPDAMRLWAFEKATEYTAACRATCTHTATAVGWGRPVVQAY